MGVTMFVQMRLNPAPADPAQQMIFTWMPIMFTFMLAPFSAGLVIYWAWNNTLSVLPAVLHHDRTAPRSSCSTTSRRCSGKRRLVSRTRHEHGSLLAIRDRSGPQAVRISLGFFLGRGHRRFPSARERGRDRLRRPLECRKIEPRECADEPEIARAHVANARPHTADQFLQGRGRSRARGPPRLRLCRRSKGQGRSMDRDGARLSHRPSRISRAFMC